MRTWIPCAIAAVALVACKPAETPPAANKAIDMSPSKDPAVTASYECEGHRVDVFGQNYARITLSDARTVTIDYVPNSRPPSYMDRGLRFAIGERAVMLIQNDGEAVNCAPIR
ncbi:hypothetical protein FCE95_12190 [Luteimonas gilva]|uniref:Lysozyme inhibitor n=1 Tax=Luteimonas gilva TaxID=2572684 RepID=A0A4U5JQV2_9GAMM|nr:hypothetical protein [Luteimonas gilva]TKR30848.1 hypothetical protein FCE95_12190 [Luteimonas gilva]